MMRQLLRSTRAIRSFLAVSAVTAVVACGGDGTGPGIGGDSIVGTWHMLSIDGEPLPTSLTQSSWMEFRSNGSFRAETRTITAPETPLVNVGSYELDGSTLLTWPEGASRADAAEARVAIDGDRMTMTQYFEDLPETMPDSAVIVWERE